MLKRSKKEETEDAKETTDADNKSETKSNEKETAAKSQNSKSQPVDEESSLKLSANEQKATAGQISDSPPTNKQDSNTKSTESLQNEENVYYIDDIVEMAGCGKFQHLVLLLCGLGWSPEAFEAILLSYLGEFMACDWKIKWWQNALLSSLVFLGLTVGSTLLGALADKQGRRATLGISLFASFVFAAGSALSPNLATMMIVRCLTGFFLGGLVQTGTLCSEYCPAGYRGIAGFYQSYYWAIAVIFIILLTWVIMETLDSWRWLLFAASLPALVVFLAIRWFPESARYYLVSRQPEKATKQLIHLACMNNIEMPKGHLKLPDDALDEDRGKIKDLLKPEHWVSTVLMWYIWFAVAFAYYGYALISPIIVTNGKLRVSRADILKAIGLNSTSSILESEMPCKKYTRRDYIDLLWTSAAEFPGLVVFTFLVKILNRKTLLCGSCLFAMLTTFLLLVDTNYRIVSNMLLFLGRANVVAIYQLTVIMTLETFPTTLRAVAMGTCAGVGGCGGVIVPFAVQLLVISHPIVTVCIVGLVIFFAALSAALLPQEMKDVNLKEMTREYISTVDTSRKG